jgi:hypothetical protein
MYEIVQKIRDESGKKFDSFEKKIKEDKKKCFIVANSHKILRYLVYKVNKDDLKKLPKILKENMEKAVAIVKE